MALQRTFKLNNNLLIPAVGLGTWQSGENEVGNAVKVALDAGYKHLDCAYVYQNEQEIGQVLSSYAAQRSNIFVTSKLWNTFHHPSRVKEACRKSIDALKTQYLDLYLIHWPFAFAYKGDSVLTPKNDKGEVETENVDITETWKAMEELVDAGMVKSIGVSNFNIANLQKILDIARIKPVMNQVEMHPYLPQNELLEFCNKNDVRVTAYSPFGTGREPKLMDDPVIQEVAKKNGKTPAQVLVSWAVQRGTVVIPKSANPERIRSNFQDFTLSEEDMGKINGLGSRKIRFIDPTKFWGMECF